MIVVQSKGGLGNQLFQYATGRRLSIAHNSELVIDSYWHRHPGKRETARPFELEEYKTQMRPATESEEAAWTPLRSRLAPVLTWYQKIFPPPPPSPKLLLERGYSANWELQDAPDFSYLVGAWQSEFYFSDIRDVLLRELTPKAPPGIEDCKVIDLIRQSVAVSVHVRRGDYVSLASASAYHGLCTLDYYRKAIAYVAERVPSPTLFVFSDDPEWTKAHLKSPFPTHYVDHNPPEKAFQDLRLMSLCRHHILANSSFSWWGAWLSDPADGLVIAPERWYAVDRPTPDLIPARWTRLAG